MHLHFIKKAKEKEKEANKLIKKQRKKLESFLRKKKTISSESKLDEFIEEIKINPKFEHLDLEKIEEVFEKVVKSSLDKDSGSDDTSSESGQIKKKKPKKKKKNKKKKRSESLSTAKNKKRDKEDDDMDIEKEDGEASDD